MDNCRVKINMQMNYSRSLQSKLYESSPNLEDFTKNYKYLKIKLIKY